MTIEEKVISYQQSHKSEEFKFLLDYFDGVIKNYHYRAHRFSKIDRDEFISECQFVLFKAISMFDTTSVKSNDKTFERYFNAALRRFVITLKRNKTKQKKRKCISIEELPFDPPDRSFSEIQVFECDDLLKNCVKGKERKVAMLKSMGQTSTEISHTLKI